MGVHAVGGGNSVAVDGTDGVEIGVIQHLAICLLHKGHTKYRVGLDLRHRPLASELHRLVLRHRPLIAELRRLIWVYVPGYLRVCVELCVLRHIGIDGLIGVDLVVHMQISFSH